MQPTHITYKQVLGKDQIQDMVGMDAPGVGYYHVPVLASSKNPTWGMPLADRFEEYSKINQHKVSNRLGYYQGPDYK